MKFRDCIKTKAAKGLISKKQAKRTVDLFEQLQKRYEPELGGEAEAKAAEETAQILTDRVKDAYNVNRRAAVFQKQVSDRLNNNLRAKQASYNSLDTRLQKMLGEKPNYGSVVGDFLEETYDRVATVRRQLYKPLNDFFQAHGSKWAGLAQDLRRMPNVMREVVGESTGDAAAAVFGGKIREVFDLSHKMFRNAGGMIGKLENYFPQGIHNAGLVRKSGFESWRSFILPLLDRERMISRETNLPLNELEMDAALRDAYSGITTNGRDELARRADEGKSTYGMGGDLWRRHESSRFFHFKNADSYLKYNRQFGYGDDGLFDAIVGHINAMARDIGIMQKMGPKANGLMHHLDLRMAAEGVSSVRQNWVKGMYDVMAGRLAARGELPVWYRGIEGAKDWLRATLLGGAPVSSLNDSVLVGLAAHMNGLEATKAIKNYFSGLNPLDQSQRRILAREGFIAESTLGTAFQTARLMEDGSGSSKFRALSGFAHRISGLNAMSQAAKDANVLLLQGTLAEAHLMGKRFADMPEDMRVVMKDRGITKEHFDVWMMANPHMHPERDGVSFLRPEDVAIVNHPKAEEAANLLDDWQNRLSYLSANEPTLRTRAITTGAALGDAREGTLLRSAVSSMMLFKSFGISQIFNFLLPAMDRAAHGRLGNLAALTLGMSVMGGFIVQVKDVLRGKDPRDMTTPKFWMAAAFQGGGFGLWGDYLFSDYNRFGQDLVTSLAGPVAGLGNDIFKLTKGTLDNAMDGNDVNFLRDLVKFAGRYTPGMSLWYSRLVMERALLDTAQKMVDPNYASRVRRMEAMARRDYGQGMWWGRGKAIPERGPELTTAAGNER